MALLNKFRCNSTNWPLTLIVVVIVAILATSCGGDSDPAESTEESSTTSEATSSEATTTDTASVSEEAEAEEPDEADASDSTDSPVQGQLNWVVDELLNSASSPDGPPSVADIEARFSPVFLAQVPAAQVAAFLPQIYAVAEAPYDVETFETSPDGLSGEAILLGADGNRLSVLIAVEAAEPNLIQALQAVPAELEFPTPLTVETLDTGLAELGPQSSLGVYDVSGGTCEPVHEIRTDNQIVLGSVFKLWVLASLADEIDQGRAAWDETVPVTDELRSSPDGEVFPMETGSEVTLERLAELMISISDNTATDLLMDRLGRETVEASLERIGVTQAEANIPMLSTGNLFALKFVPDPPNAADYLALDINGRRAMLAELDEAALPWVDGSLSDDELTTTPNADGVPIDQPRDLDLEWFATAEDLCRTLVHLDELAARPGLEPVAAVLEINPGAGVPFDRDRWPTIRFKGGSEPGVLAGAWWLQGPEGDDGDTATYVVAGGVANPEEPVNPIEAVLILAAASELIE